ncbi:hypothetical protein [Amycolatopsis sp. NPDC004378]
MAKQSGLGDNLYWSGYAISNDIRELGKVGGGFSPIDSTGIDKSAMERIGGLRDGGIDLTGYLNPETIAGGGTVDGAHKVLSPLATADQLVTYCRGTSLGAPAACCTSKQLNYDLKRATSGEITLDVSAAANAFGLEWGVQLTQGKRTDATATNGTGVDMGPGSPPGFTGPANFGAQFYLHVFAFTGTSVTVKVQESSDNGVGDPWADVVGGTFTAAAGRTFERLQTARNQTVKRYLRAITTGTFTNAVFAVVAVRNDISTVF